MPHAATEAPARLLTLTAALMADLHSVGMLVRGGDSLEHPLLERMSASAVAVLDAIEAAAPGLGELPAAAGDEVRHQVADALLAVRLFEKVLEFRL